MKAISNLAFPYYALALVGLVATWAFNIRYLLGGGGLGPTEFFGAAFANPLTTAITLDVYLAALVFSIWAVSDARRHAIRGAWAYVVLCFAVGLAFAYPLYLARRESLAARVGVDG